MTNKPIVAVLMGGQSAERDVSLVSGKACANALESSGHYTVVSIDAGADMAQQLITLKPAVALNCLHGGAGEDGRVQGVLEMLGIPYTHSGVLASALAMDKNRAKAVLRAAGVPVPAGGLFNRHDVATRHVLPPPYVVKPNAEGSSVGVIRVMEGANTPPRINDIYDDTVLVEPYIAGRELAVAVLGNKALAVTEITTHRGFYDYEAKYGEGGSQHTVPANLPDAITQAAMRMAEAAHTALGCRGLSRTDIRYDADKQGLVVLEVNTQPGMTPMSLAPEQAIYTGMGFADLVQWLVKDASCNR